MEQMSDEYLMESFRNDCDVQYFNELAKRYSAKALHVAWQYFYEKTAAEDAVQEAFLRVIGSRDQFRSGSMFAPWFYRLLRNICIDALRKQRTQNEFLGRWGADWERSCDDPEPLDGSAPEALLAGLPLNEREVIAMKLLQGMSFADIAVALDCTVEAVKKRSQRGLKKLRELYSRSNSVQKTAQE